MGLIDKVKSFNKVSSNLDQKLTNAENRLELTPDEIKFILTKLRTADYKGVEFEKFFTVYSKLQDNLDNTKK